MTSVLVTGASGLIGGHLARALFAAGFSVAAVVHRTAGQFPTGVRVVQADLSAPTRALPPAEIIIHAAGATSLDPTRKLSDYVRANVITTQHIVEDAVSMGARRIIYMSSLAVYGQISTPTLDERTPMDQPDAYGTTKYLGELTLRENAQKVQAVIVRLPGVLGEGSFGPWLCKVIRALKANQNVIAYNPDAPFNNLVTLEELTRFVVHSLTVEVCGAETLNLAATEPLPIRDVLRIATGRIGSASRVEFAPSVRHSFTVGTRYISECFGFTPAATRTELERYLDAVDETKAP